MTENKRLDLSKEQKKTKPMIEEVIPDVLNGNMRDIALDFCSYLRAKKMKPVWSVTNGWKSLLNGKVICYIRLATDDWNTAKHLKGKYGKYSWVVTLYINNTSKYEDEIKNSGLQNFIWDNVHECMLCRSPCHGRPPGMDVVILDKKIKNICWGRPLTWVFDPDEAAIKSIKRLLELELQARTEM